MPVQHITSVAEFDAILSNTTGNQYILVDFFATWCGPCKRIAPKLEEFSKIYTTVTFLKVDIEEVAELATRYGVRSLPTFAIFKVGETTPHYTPIIGADQVKIENLLKTVTNHIKPTTLSANNF